MLLINLYPVVHGCMTLYGFTGHSCSCAFGTRPQSAPTWLARTHNVQSKQFHDHGHFICRQSICTTLYMVVSPCMGSQDSHVAAHSGRVRKALLCGSLQCIMYQVISSMTTFTVQVVNQFVPCCT